MTVKIPESLKEALLQRKDLPDALFKDFGTLADSTFMEGSNKEYVIKNYRVIRQKKRDFILPTA